jgi:uncharacterized protein (TIGR03437 family)
VKALINMRYLCAFLLSVGLVLPAGAQTGFQNFQAARGVIGQPIFAGGVYNISQSTVGAVQGVAASSNRVFVADGNILSLLPQNNRVLIFDSTQIPAPHADLTGLQPPGTTVRCVLCNFSAINVLGEPDYVTPNPGAGIAPTVVPPTQSNMYAPTAVATDGTILVVADTNYNRVLIYNSIPTTIDASPNLVLGQANLTALQSSGTLNASSLRGPQGVWIQNGKLFVADTGNSRILIWNAMPTTNNQPADVVLGEPNFTTRFVAVSNVALAGAANTMYNPTSVTSDGTRLFVTDNGYNRVLIWNSIPTTNQQAADLEVGQPSMTAASPNNVVGFCASNGTNTTTNTPTYPFRCEKTLSYPRFALADNTGRLFIADGGNDRVLIYKSIPTANGVGADNVLGQPDFVSDVVTDQTQLITSTVVSNNSSSNTVRAPSSLAWDGTNLYVTDPFDLRVLYFTPGDPSLVLPNEAVLNAASMEIHAEGYIVIGLVSGDSITKGDTVTATIAGTGYTYTVVSGDTLQTIADGLVNVINTSNTNSGDPNAIAVSVTGAIVALSARAQGAAGNAITLSASVSTGATITATASGLELTGGNGATLGPGTYVVFNAPPGVSLSPDGGSYTANSAPLPVSYHGVQVYFDGIPGSIAYVTPSQIRVQMPFNYQGTDTGSTYVRLNNLDGSVSTSNAINLTIVPANPGIFTMGTATPPEAIAVHASSNASAVVSVDGTITAGNTATVSINSRPYSYTVLAADTLNTVQAALVAEINADPQVTATASSAFTRIIIQARIPGPAGNGIPVAASTSTGATIILTAFNAATCCANTAGSPVTTENPAAENELINIFGTGLGVLANGQGSPAGYPYLGPVPNSVDQANFVSATLAGATAQVLNAGFPYGSIGIYQIELQMPAGLATSNNAQLYIAQNAFISNIVTIPVTSTSGTGLSLSPNPIVVASGPLVGTVTVTFTASVSVNIYANGTLLCNGFSSGTCTTGNWVTDGMIFTMVDPVTGNTLATAIASVQPPSATLAANPNPIINDGSGVGTTTIIVNANTPVDIKADGTLLCGPVASGSCVTGKWVSSTTVFTAVLPGTDTVLATLTVPLQNPSGTISLSPNPIGVTDGFLGTTTVNFSANVLVNVYANGTFFCGGFVSGSCTTGNWVTNGMVFTLQNPAANNAVLASVTAQVQTVPPSGTISLPNPIVVTDGTGLAIVSVSFSANVPADLYVNGTFYCGPSTSTTCTTGKWVQTGTVFTLKDDATGALLSTATAVVQVPSGTLSANPNPVIVTDGSGLGITTINYSANVPVNVYANGTFFCGGGGQTSGSCTTGKWVSTGTVFTLFSYTTNQLLATLIPQVQSQ